MLPKYTYYVISLLLFVAMSLRLMEFGEFTIAVILNIYLSYISDRLGKMIRMRIDKNEA